jgi:opacity protein-like surface antigen
MMRRVAGQFAVWGVLLAGSAPASGQDFLRKEVFGVIGVGKTYDDEGSLGKGINGGGGFGYRLSRRFGAELEVNAFKTRREFASVVPAYESNGVHIMANGLLYLNQGRTQGYLIFGAGLLHFRNTMGFAGVDFDRSGNGLAVGIGAGLKIFVKERLSLRPEFRIYGGAAGGAVEPPFTDMRASMGLGYHW